MDIEISQEVFVFIYRKVIVILAILLSLYRLHRKQAIFEAIYTFVFLYFFTFSRIAFTKIGYDLFDKLVIFFIAPVYILYLSILFFRQKSLKDMDKIGKLKYFATLALFAITELQLIFRDKIYTRQR